VTFQQLHEKQNQTHVFSKTDSRYQYQYGNPHGDKDRDRATSTAASTSATSNSPALGSDSASASAMALGLVTTSPSRLILAPSQSQFPSGGSVLYLLPSTRPSHPLQPPLQGAVPMPFSNSASASSSSFSSSLSSLSLSSSSPSSLPFSVSASDPYRPLDFIHFVSTPSTFLDWLGFIFQSFLLGQRYLFFSSDLLALSHIDTLFYNIALTVIYLLSVVFWLLTMFFHIRRAIEIVQSGSIAAATLNSTAHLWWILKSAVAPPQIHTLVPLQPLSSTNTSPLSSSSSSSPVSLLVSHRLLDYRFLRLLSSRLRFSDQFFRLLYVELGNFPFTLIQIIQLAVFVIQFQHETDKNVTTVFIFVFKFASLFLTLIICFFAIISLPFITCYTMYNFEQGGRFDYLVTHLKFNLAKRLNVMMGFIQYEFDSKGKKIPKSKKSSSRSASMEVITEKIQTHILAPIAENSSGPKITPTTQLQGSPITKSEVIDRNSKAINDSGNRIEIEIGNGGKSENHVEVQDLATVTVATTSDGSGTRSGPSIDKNISDIAMV